MKNINVINIDFELLVLKIARDDLEIIFTDYDTKVKQFHYKVLEIKNNLHITNAIFAIKFNIIKTQFDKNGNIIFYIRKSQNNSCSCEN